MGVMPSASQCSLVFDLPSGLSIFGGERHALGEAPPEGGKPLFSIVVCMVIRQTETIERCLATPSPLVAGSQSEDQTMRKTSKDDYCANW
jgi:hypothetical protein